MKKTNKNGLKVNHVAIVLDASSSMNWLSSQVRKLYNQIINDIKEESKLYGQKTYLTVMYFADQVTFALRDSEIEFVEPRHISYNAYGNTALFDGVGEASESLKNLKLKGKNLNESYLVIVLTDGQENISTKYKAPDIVRLIKDNTKKGNWTYAFQLPPGQKNIFCQRFNIPLDNVREWEISERGILEAIEKTSGGIKSFYQARSVGHMSTEKFYTDLSKVTNTKLNQKLTDISDALRVLKVEHECEIRDFVESKTKKPYVKGTCYYQLTKPETVQANKELVIMNKATNHLYGGFEARSLIGIPQGKNAKVIPGNHANYEIFVMSTSVNRKLVRGTKLLVEKGR